MGADDRDPNYSSEPLRMSNSPEYGPIEFVREVVQAAYDGVTGSNEPADYSDKTMRMHNSPQKNPVEAAHDVVHASYDVIRDEFEELLK